MRKEVRSPAHRWRFEQARMHHPALAEHGTLPSVLAVLNGESPEQHGAREGLALALIREQQERPHAFWTAVLFVTYFPMLSRLRGRIYVDGVAADDLDQLVITAFLEAVHGLSLERRCDWISARLRSGTHREVFRKLRRERRELERVSSTEPCALVRREEELLDQQYQQPWPEVRPGKKRPPEPEECQQLVEFLVEHVDDAIEPDKLQPVIATLIRGQRLRAYVDEVYPNLEPGERQRAYERIKKRHSRTMAKLRKALAHLRCAQDASEATLPLGVAERRSEEATSWMASHDAVLR